MSKKAEIIIKSSTMILLLIILISCILINEINISTHYSFVIWSEFFKAMLVWYITSLLCCWGIDYSINKSRV